MAVIDFDCAEAAVDINFRSILQIAITSFTADCKVTFFKLPLDPFQHV